MLQRQLRKRCRTFIRSCFGTDRQKVSSTPLTQNLGTHKFHNFAYNFILVFTKFVIFLIGFYEVDLGIVDEDHAGLKLMSIGDCDSDGFADLITVTDA